MKSTLRLFLGGILAVAFSVCAQAANLEPGSIAVNQVLGNVTCKFPGTEDFVSVTNGKIIPKGSVVKTGEGSTVNLEFSSGATALVRPNSEIEITKFEQELFSGGVGSIEEPSVSSTKLNLVSGEVVSNVKKLKMGSEYVVTTPVGSAGVRGTFFSVRFDRATNRLIVSTLLGAVEVSLTDGTVVETVYANEQAVVEAGKTTKIILPAYIKKELSSLLRSVFGEARANDIIRIIETSQIGVSFD